MSSTAERKLAAIMFTDIAGYTAQMSKDEARAMELLKEKESAMEEGLGKTFFSYPIPNAIVKEYNKVFKK